MQPSPIDFTPSECEFFSMPEAMRSFDWIRKNVRVVAGPYKGQLWNPAISPSAEEILDILDDEQVRKVFLIAPSQSTKTTIIITWLLAALMRRLDNVGYGLADESSVRRMFTKTLHEYFRLCTPLKKKLKGIDALQNTEIQLTGGAAILGMWSGSDSRARSFSAPIVVVDEEDSYHDKSAVLAMEERPDAYAGLGLSKIARLCRPKGNEDESTIWIDANAEADAWLVREAVCPACRAAQIMEHHNIVARDGSTDPQRIRREKLGRYRCEKCGYLWTDQARNQALMNGQLVSIRGKRKGAVVVAVHMRAWESPLVSLSDVLCQWFEAQGNPRKLQRFDNNVCAKPYKFVQLKQSESELARCISEHLPVGVVPDWAKCLTFAADMQKDHFKYSVCAHGLPRAEHIVDYGVVRTFEELQDLIFDSRFRTLDGNEFGIWRAAVDTGGGKNKDEQTTRTMQAYLWLLSLRPGVVFGTKGMSRIRVGEAVYHKVLDKYPDGRAIRGGLSLHFIDTDLFKRDCFWRLAEGWEEEPITFHSDTTQEYLKEIASEELERQKNGKEVWIRKRANHWLDCLTTHLALAHWQWKPSLNELAGSIEQAAPVKDAAIDAKDKPKKQENPFTDGMTLFGGEYE
ncbi:terminase gpA endonuclease subunit [Halodesulfovibrio aestuarii]|uniref:Phage terminase, large subunit GpA n=1 Tax=Halodesulfovibrio aestuarii TaxID=126333 RepID=A0A8G2CC94_9BACT|nr:terminase gpA endonuclease subunit [Halodesulfovibrio aestuarii]SHJ74961.1 Phage terminase, large subunit GpA [Halodesulfovibrio aestuarii]